MTSIFCVFAAVCRVAAFESLPKQRQCFLVVEFDIMARQFQNKNGVATAFMACCIFTVLMFSSPTIAAESNDALPQPVERASADDCAILVEVGKNQMNWGVVAPDFAFYPEFDRAGGGTYLQDCPWKALGVAEPLRPSQQPERSFFITRPAYKGEEATVSLQYSISGKIVDGRRTPPFIRRSKCTLEKKGDRWQITICELEISS